MNFNGHNWWIWLTDQKIIPWRSAINIWHTRSLLKRIKIQKLLYSNLLLINVNRVFIISSTHRCPFILIIPSTFYWEYLLLNDMNTWNKTAHPFNKFALDIIGYIDFVLKIIIINTLDKSIWNISIGFQCKYSYNINNGEWMNDVCQGLTFKFTMIIGSISWTSYQCR